VEEISFENVVLSKGANCEGNVVTLMPYGYMITTAE
jgi:hypothetical protein